MNIKKPDTTPFFVLFAKQKTRRGISGEICFGGNFKREKCERIIRNPFSKIAEGTACIVEFPSKKAAWAAHGDLLDVAHGRVKFP
tara:strand:- start:1615 stop:1869 length:255 start_codon:yes stop_codon:yes gene_type:complete